MRRARRTAREARRRRLVSAAGILGAIVVWQVLIAVFRVPQYIAPSPLAVAHALVAERRTLLINAWPTILETLGGFLVGNIVAVAIAVGFVHNRNFQQTVYPLAVAIRTIPIVAISPILVLLLNRVSEYAPKIAIAALITFFPTLVNMVDGLRAVDPQALELMRVLSGSKWEVLRYLRWPTSLPYLFSALRIASTAALLGAVVAEWIGAQAGLGYLILATTYDFRTPLLYATMVVASAIALALFAAISILERSVVSWRQEEVRE
jgi:NitT/TauT family transport system permease protein